MKIIPAEYECVKCNHKWTDKPGPITFNGTETKCPSCGSLYMKWLNYERDYEKGNK